MSADQYECEHGHRYYDGDQGVGNPYDDGDHDAWFGHAHAEIESWEPFERNAYETGWADAKASAT